MVLTHSIPTSLSPTLLSLGSLWFWTRLCCRKRWWRRLSLPCEMTCPCYLSKRREFVPEFSNKPRLSQRPKRGQTIHFYRFTMVHICLLRDHVARCCEILRDVASWDIGSLGISQESTLSLRLHVPLLLSNSTPPKLWPFSAIGVSQRLLRNGTSMHAVLAYPIWFTNAGSTWQKMTKASNHHKASIGSISSELTRLEIISHRVNMCPSQCMQISLLWV